MPTIEEVIPGSTKEFFTKLRGLPFDPSALQGDVGNAWFCAEASALAYKNARFIAEFSKKILKPQGWTAKVYEMGSTQAVLLLSKEAAVLAFRGTRVEKFWDFREAPINFRDLAVDFSAALLSVEDHGRIHSGFYNAFRDFWKRCGLIIVNQFGTRPLHLTGHSLGGALATVAARQIIGNLASLYTFGSPTVGDETFRQGFETLKLPAFRFVHGYDLVTTVAPPELQYTHVGDTIHICESDTGVLSRRAQHTLFEALQYNVRHIPEGIVEVVKQLGDIISSGLPALALPKDALVEHAPINYCRKLGMMEIGRKLPEP